MSHGVHWSFFTSFPPDYSDNKITEWPRVNLLILVPFCSPCTDDHSMFYNDNLLLFFHSYRTQKNVCYLDFPCLSLKEMKSHLINMSTLNISHLECMLFDGYKVFTKLSVVFLNLFINKHIHVIKHAIYTVLF